MTDRSPDPTVLLVVDDDPTVLELIRQSVEGQGRTVLAANCAEGALEIVARQGQLDLAIIDKNLGAVSGLDLARDLRSRYPNAEAIIVTADPSIESAVDAIGLRVFDYVAKPFHIGEIQKKVSEALAVVEQRRSRERRLQHLYQMEAVGTLTASIAHEINNPLTYVLANLQMISRLCPQLRDSYSAETIDLIEEVAAEANEGAIRIAAIIRDLKYFAHREDQGAAGPVDINKAVGAAVQFVGNQLRHRTRITVDLGAPPSFAGSELRLGQVFVNLLMNAIQALPENRAEDNEIRVRTGVDAQGWVVAEVEDNGCGIPVEDRARIFDRFYTTKDVGHGTGLGLAICRHYIDEAGGRIEVDSEVGKGTKFRVLLPPAEPNGPLGSAGARVQAPGTETLPPGKVLIIDDDVLLGHAFKRMLSGFDVTVINNGAEAIEVLRAGETFDVILCDLMMPGANGVDVHAAVMELSPKRADEIIFITGGVFTARVAAFRARVPNRIIEKPVSIMDLRELVAGRLQGLGGLPSS